MNPLKHWSLANSIKKHRQNKVNDNNRMRILITERLFNQWIKWADQRQSNKVQLSNNFILNCNKVNNNFNRERIKRKQQYRVKWT